MTTIESKNNTTAPGEKETYIMVWIDESATFHYFKEDFDEEQFPDGYVAYYIEVVDGIIVRDTYNDDNVGKVFSEQYIWNA